MTRPPLTPWLYVITALHPAKKEKELADMPACLPGQYAHPTFITLGVMYRTTRVTNTQNCCQPKSVSVTDENTLKLETHTD